LFKEGLLKFGAISSLFSKRFGATPDRKTGIPIRFFDRDFAAAI
jgi:hypothetical protein